MILNVIQIILVLAIFFPTKWFAWKITEQWGLPEWLSYKPYVCKKCLSFWLLMAFYLTCGLVIHLYITMTVGGLLTALDAIAQTIDQRQRTIKIENI